MLLINIKMVTAQEISRMCNISIWKQLRKPFALTEQMNTLHSCKWENIEIDTLGCVLCGAIHACHIDTCEVVHVSDATVCVVSGVCVKTQNFKQEEFCDRVAPYCFCESISVKKRTVSSDVVNSHVNEILCSISTEESFEVNIQRELQKVILKCTKYLDSECVQTGKSCNVISMIENVFSEQSNRNKMLCGYNRQLRKKCAQKVMQKITSILNFYQLHCNKSIKPLEIKTYVVGLLYLMRSGVIVNNLQVVGRVDLLSCILPSENLLDSFFSFRSKNITDIENRFKLFFRQIPSLVLQKMSV
tara:strand:- start:1886 stop:2791 length:906 start_codon:yes stop_codon:yes gene_type:complete